MVMTLKQALFPKGESKSAPARRRDVVIRITNPRTKDVKEFGIPVTAEGFDPELWEKVTDVLGEILCEWGLVEPAPGEPSPNPDAPGEPATEHGETATPEATMEAPPPGDEEFPPETTE